MIGTLGTWALATGLVAAVATALLWSRAALSDGDRATGTARAGTVAVLAAAVASCALLEWALLTHDFNIRYVADNGGRHVPLYFTVTSLWAALDGSLLLWLLILGAFAVLLATTGRARQLRAHHWAMTAISVVAVFFFALTYFAANPFRPVDPVPADGPGPNPLLAEHPAMGIHPPLLYAGYVGLVVPFALAVGALLSGRTGPAWLAVTRRWTLVAWTFLTAGILLGAWWSYAVLGWGGYWAWDPVENASLLPWLTATAALHTMLVRRRGSALTAWTVTLLCATFLLVLVGTFLTRSGVVASVHSFTQSPLGPMLLGFVLLVTATVAGLLVWRAGSFTAGAAPGRVLSRESAVVANAVLLVAFAAVVLTGTVFPLVAEAITGDRSAVGRTYFDRATGPVALVVLALMGAAPLLRRRHDDATAVGRRLALPAAAGLATVAAVGLFTRPGVAALVAFGLGAFVLACLAGPVRTVLTGPGPGLPRRLYRLGGLVAHAGIAVAAVGIAASSAYTTRVEHDLAVGDTITAGSVTARLVGIDRAADGAADGAMSASAVLALERDGTPIGVARPELRYFPARDMAVSVPHIRSRPLGDIYLTVTGVDQNGGGATVRLAVNPLVSLVWAGGAITALGGLVALVRPVRTRLPGTRHTREREESTA